MDTANINPYELTATQAFASRINNIRTDITKQAIVDGNSSKIFYVTEDHRDIGIFEHPILFTTPSVSGQRVAIDVRAFRGNNPMVKEQQEVLRKRAALMLQAVESKGPMVLFDAALQVAYATILVGVLAKQFNLDPVVKMQLTVVIGAFYYCITREEGHQFTDEDGLVMAKSLVRNLRLPSEVVTSILTRFEYGRTLEVLVKNIKEIEGTDRTVMLSPAILINALSGLWFGVNSSQILAICLEHPPTWAAMIYEATGDGTYSRSELAKRLKNLSLIRPRVPHLHALVNQIVAGVDEDERHIFA